MSLDTHNGPFCETPISNRSASGTDALQDSCSFGLHPEASEGRCSFVARENEKAPRGIHLSARRFSGGKSSPALFHGDCELDATDLKRDLERVGVTRIEIGSDQVKLPVITNLVEGNVGNIRNARFVHVVNRAPHAGQHGYRTTTSVEEYRVRIGDEVAVGVAHRELYRNGAPALALEHAAAVVVDRRKDNASRLRPNADPIDNGVVHSATDVIVIGGAREGPRVGGVIARQGMGRAGYVDRADRRPCLAAHPGDCSDRRSVGLAVIGYGIGRDRHRRSRLADG